MLMNRQVAALAALFFVLPGGRASHGQAPTPGIPLTQITSLKCTFPVSVSTAWEAGEPQVQVKKSPVLTLSPATRAATRWR